jgi:hypothetical protein
MPPRAADQTYWCPEHRRSALGAAGLRRIDWERRPAAHPAGTFDRRGRERQARGPAPGSFYLAIDILWNERRKEFGASAPDARPQKTGARSSLRNQRAAALALNGQRVGELQESFWTAAWRLITRLESRLRSQVQGHKALARSIESE